MLLRRVFVPIALLLLSIVTATAAAADTHSFADTAGTVHEDAVTALVDRDVITGCGDGEFCAREAVTRGQFTTMLAAAVGLDPVEPGAPTFSDTEDSWHTAAIEAVAAEGLVAGCGDGRFCPGEPITREQFASMIDAAFAVPDAPADARYFEDIAGMHEPAVRAIAEAGITAGCTESLTAFCPGQHVERAHAAMFLARGMGLVAPVELAPYDERRAEQDAIDEAAAEEAAEAAAEAERAAAEAAEPTPGEIAVEEALSHLGKPYRWGGSGPSSFDCSGLMAYAWAAAGESLPHNSGMQYSATTRISRSELRPGDLVFYHSPISHVAMYIGDGRVVEAPNSGNQVRIREDGLTRSGIVGYGRV